MSAREPRTLPLLSEEFGRLRALCAGERVTFRVLMGGMTPRDHALFTLALCSAFMHPFPMMGLTFPLSLGISVAGARMSWGLGPWVPERWKDRPLPAKLFRVVFGGFARVLRPVERLLSPRGRFLSQHPWMRRANGGCFVVIGLLLLVPLPAPGNVPPAAAGVLLSLGVLEDDLAFMAMGWLGTIVTAAGFAALAV
ncbi:MAG: exopolysaccharide biosynthesis protein, partial [Elusimicrobia bacterium]|nr:exopolysaccharide biosynthesis protein [Elusimicrobiota bacterium]